MISHPSNGYFYIIEGDHRVMGEEAKQKKLEELVDKGKIRNIGISK